MKKIILGTMIVLYICLSNPVVFAQEATVICFTIPANRIDAVVTAFCKTNNYGRNKLIDETRLEFTERMIRNYIKEMPVAYQTKAGVKSRKNEIRNQVQTEMEDITTGTN